MKENGYSFGKKEYESFMRRIDVNNKGRVTSTDLKFQLFPLGSVDELSQSFNQDFHQNKTGSLFGGISPIKPSPKKSNPNTEIKIPSGTQAFDRDSFEERDQKLSPSNRNQYLNNPDIRIPSGPMKNTASPTGIKSEGRIGKNEENLRNKAGSMGESSIHQMLSQSNYDKRSSFEHRHLDPVYNRYWNNKGHNETLSPDYFNYAVKKTIYDYQGKSTYDSRPVHPSYYSQSLVDTNHFVDLQRYPENPFRYTDHQHYFQNYFSKLRKNYYDDYYNLKPHPIQSLSKTVNSTTKILEDPNFLKQEQIAQRHFSRSKNLPQHDQKYEIKINSQPLSQTDDESWKVGGNQFRNDILDINSPGIQQSKPYSYVVVNQ